MGALFNVKSKLGCSVVLFVVGSLLGFCLIVLHTEYNYSVPSSILVFVSNYGWIIPIHGLAAIYIGLCYPLLDKIFGQSYQQQQDLTLLIRSVCFYIGLNHLCAKILFENLTYFIITLTSFCLLFWYWFDRTPTGLYFNVTNALLSSLLAHYLHQNNMLKLNQKQYEYLQVCLASLLFAGGVCMGNIGRLLVNSPGDDHLSHAHTD